MSLKAVSRSLALAPRPQSANHDDAGLATRIAVQCSASKQHSTEGTAAAAATVLHDRLQLPCCNLASRQLDIVVSHCAEDLQKLQHVLHTIVSVPAIAALETCVHVYTKCREREHVRQALPAAILVDKLDNIGREGHTYLTHIVRHYDNLPAFSVFLQAGVEVEDRLVPRLETLNSTTGFINLGNPWVSQAVHENGEKHQEEHFIRLPELYSWVYQDLAPPQIDLTYQGQFLVAKQRLLHHPLRFYQKLLQYLTAPQGHFVTQDYKFIRHPKRWDHKKRWANPTPDQHLNDPFFGHVLERAWGFIFLCGPEKDNPAVTDGLRCL